MTLNESIGRFNVRKTLRFEMKPVGKTADHLDALLADDEDRAASLNTVKAVIEAEHLALIRRVFKSLPDPLPDYTAIKEAFKADPEHDILSGRNANAVMKTVIERCLQPLAGSETAEGLVGVATALHQVALALLRAVQGGGRERGGAGVGGTRQGRSRGDESATPHPQETQGNAELLV